MAEGICDGGGNERDGRTEKINGGKSDDGSREELTNDFGEIAIKVPATAADGDDVTGFPIGLFSSLVVAAAIHYIYNELL